MMEFHYDLCGAEPIVRDIRCYDASALAKGEMVMLGTTDPDSNADHGVAFVTAYTGANTEAIDALGIINEDASLVTVTTLPGAGEVFLKCVINPFAIYRAEYDQTTTSTATSSSTTTLTLTTLEDDIDTGWVYMVAGSPTANTGSLRYVSASADGSLTMYAALPSTDTGSTFIKILPVFHRLTALNTAATKLKSQTAAGSGVSLQIVENYIKSSGHNLQPLRYADHKNLDNLSNAKFYADISMLDHVFNPYKN